MVQAVLMLRPYPEGTRFKILTYHDGLCWILNLAEASRQLTRWRPRPSEFEFNFVPLAGIKYQAADALLWLPTNGVDKSDLNNALPVLTSLPANKAKEEKEIDENTT